MGDEPASEHEARRWIGDQIRATDPYRDIAEATERHRALHGCETYPSSDGPLLGILARAIGARRSLPRG